MSDVSGDNETIPAWNEASLVPDIKAEQPADLQLHVVHAGTGALTVEVADGALDSANGALLLDGLGWFEVTATLRRVVDGNERIYLRLRPTSTWDPGAA